MTDPPDHKTRPPDGTPVEFIELPGGARSTYQIHRGVPLQMGPVR